MVWKYPDDVIKFVSDNVKGKRPAELAEMVNTKFGTEFTQQKMKAFMKNHNLKNGCPKHNTTGSKLYPDQIKKFIDEHYIGTGHQAMVDLLNQSFGTNFTKEQMKAYYARFKLDSGLTGRFPKGHVPANKGTHNGGWEPTQFKKGSTPHNRVPIGTERVDSKDGYIYVKIQDGHLNKNWKQKHVMIWEKHYGPIPKNHVVIFGDGNKLNFEPENLILVTRAQLAVLNKHNLIQDNAELTKTAIVIADLKIKIGQRRKANHEQSK
jgi:hypothetical protein